MSQRKSVPGCSLYFSNRWLTQDLTIGEEKRERKSAERWGEEKNEREPKMESSLQHQEGLFRDVDVVKLANIRLLLGRQGQIGAHVSRAPQTFTCTRIAWAS